jgi:hypothetical protein
LRREEESRVHLEQTVSQELERVQEGFRKEYDAFRAQQYSVAEKVN